MRAFVAIGLILTVASCRIESKEQPGGLAPHSSLSLNEAFIESFTVTPQNVPVGGEVKILVSGSGFEECDLFANDELFDQRLKVDQVIVHNPMIESQTTYRVVCGSSMEAASVAESAFTVNVFAVERSLELANLNDIKTNFDFSAIEDAVRQVTDEPISEFDPNRLPDIATPELEVISWAQKHDSVGFNPVHSILWGYEGNLGEVLEKANTECQERFEFTSELAAAAEYGGQDDIEVIGFKEAVPGVHLSNFRAVTETQERPVPAGSQWDASLDIAQTVISYTQNAKIYGTATGIFEFSNEGEVTRIQQAPQSNSYGGMLSGLNNYVFPWRYPLVPPGNGLYELDPESEECNQTEESAVVTRPLQEIRDAIRRGVLRETDYRVINTREDIWKDPEVEGADWQRTTLQAIRFFPVGYYLRGKKFPSARIVEVQRAFNCVKHFPELAKKMDFEGDDWNVFTKLQFYVAKDGRFLDRWTDNETENWDGEPANNQCINRWEGRPFDEYRDRLLAACKRSQKFVNEKTKRRASQQNQAMYEKCRTSGKCQQFLDGLKKWNDIGLSILSTQSHVDSLESSIVKAREGNDRLLVSKSDPVFSKLHDLKGAYHLLSSGMRSILLIHRESQADWAEAIELSSDLESVPSDFDMSSKVNDQLDRLKMLISRIEALGKVTIGTHICDYSISGAFRVFDSPKIGKVESVKLDQGVTIELKNIIPIEAAE